MITIVNFGTGNLGSMVNMFKRLGVTASIEADPEAIRQAEKLVLPGVGAFDATMQRINDSVGLRDVLDYKALTEQVPVLGVCLGMQLLTRGSEEGALPGLGWIQGATQRFPSDAGLKVPHMGWNTANCANPSKLTIDVGVEPRYYFVHSYCVAVDDPADSIMRTHYGLDFDSAIGRHNIYGVQFHPEKSGDFGRRVMQNFVGI